MGHRRYSLVALLGVLAACSGESGDITRAAAADVTFSVSGGEITGPDSVTPGWARVRVEEDGAGHRVVIFRLAESMTDSELTNLLAAIDTATTTPAPALALGGPEVGNSGDVVIELTPGRYVLGCVVRAGDGHRHVNIGEAKMLRVTNAPVAADRAVPPSATQNVQMVDFAYLGPERWPAGSHMLRVHNEGRQDHVLILARLRPGSSMQDWMDADDPGGVATSVAGVARLGPGAVAYLPVELRAGAYVVFCPATDPKSGRVHVELGMLRAIQVE